MFVQQTTVVWVTFSSVKNVAFFLVENTAGWQICDCQNAGFLRLGVGQMARGFGKSSTTTKCSTTAAAANLSYNREEQQQRVFS